MISFRCGQCGKDLKVKDHLAGKKVMCPGCGKPAPVPIEQDTVGPGQSARPAMPDRDASEDRTLAPRKPAKIRVLTDSEAAKAEKTKVGGRNVYANYASGAQPFDGETDPPTEAERYDFLAPAEQADEIGRLGPYRVLKVLGAGGMGVVFKAEDPQLKRLVALKVMLPALANTGTAKQRFLREARTAAAINHDNIVHIYQVGEDRGVPFMAMQFLEGEPLDDRLKREGRLGMSDAMRIGREVAEGLAAAHDKELVHRDIKPGNIWLEGKKARAKILDFGLARTAADDTHLTQTGAIVGTPAYMAPEQAEGKAIDFRCDLFSLGCVLYRMCTGEMPFKGDSTLAIISALALKTPAPPCELDHDVPRPLSELVMQLLAKKPKERPQSAQAVAEAIQDIEKSFSGEPTKTSGQWSVPSGQQLQAGKRKTKQLLLVGGGVLGVAALGLVIFLMASRERQRPENAVLPATFTNAATDPDRKAAEYVLSIGGMVRVNHQEQEIKATAEVPKEAFKLTSAYLTETKVSDAGLASFKGCRDLAVLSLYGTHVGDAGLAHFQDCKNLTILNLHGTTVGDAGLASFKGCKDLTNLSLGGTKVSDAGIAYFKDCKNLMALDLVHTQVSDAGLAHFKDCKKLRDITLRATNVSDTGLAHFKNCKDLATLDLSHTRVSDAGLASFKDCKNLTSLSLRITKVSDAGIAYLKDCKNLEQLALDGTQVSDAGLAYLKDCKNLTYLLLQKTKVTAAKIEELKKALPKCKIEWDGGVIEPRADPDRKAAEYVLSIGGIVMVNGEGNIKAVAELPAEAFRLTGVLLYTTKVTDAGLACFKDCLNLTRLQLEGCNQLSDAGLAVFKDCKNLTSLWLQNMQVGNAGLAHFKECKNLSSLILNSTQVTDAGLAHFKDCKNWTSIVLPNTDVSDAGLSHFKDCENLTALTLFNTQVSDAGLAHFKDCKKLTALFLGGPLQTDAGLAHFKGCKNLTFLGLGEAPFSDAGLGLFKDCKNLTQLNLQRTQVTDAGLAQLKDLNLQHVQLVDTKVSDAGFAHLKNLTSLSLQAQKVGDARLAHLKQCKGLTILHLVATQVSDAGLAHLKDCKNLTYLGLQKTKVTAAKIEELKKALPKCKIEWDGGIIEPTASDPDRKAAEYVLSIGGTVWINDQERDLKAVAELPAEPFRLTGVLLQTTKVRDSDLTCFKNCMNLAKLYLENCNQLSDPGLAVFRDCKNLTTLYLQNMQVGDAGLAHFKDCKNLTSLSLNGMPVSDAGLAHFKDCKNWTCINLANLASVTDGSLAHFKDCKNLTILGLSLAGVSDTGLAHFKDCNKLTLLSLGGPLQSDAGLAHFKDCKDLVILGLGQAPFSDAGLALFKDCKNLTQLSLKGTQVTDAGLAQLKDLNLDQIQLIGTKVSDGGLAHLKNLTVLILNDSKVGDAGVVHLIKQCKGLIILQLANTQVSDAGLAHVKDCKNLTHLLLQKKKALPKCRIVWDGGIIEPTASAHPDRKAAARATLPAHLRNGVGQGRERFLRPEGPILSAQAEGLGKDVTQAMALKGPFNPIDQPNRERPFQGRLVKSSCFPGLRPGLTESAFQAEIPRLRVVQSEVHHASIFGQGISARRFLDEESRAGLGGGVA